LLVLVNGAVISARARRFLPFSGTLEAVEQAQLDNNHSLKAQGANDVLIDEQFTSTLIAESPF
jgi:hypothetical protein